MNFQQMFPSILRLKEKWEVHQLCELMKRMKITPVMHWVAISCTHRILDEKGTPEISASSRLKAAKGPKCFPKGFREASCRITNKTHGFWGNVVFFLNIRAKMEGILMIKPNHNHHPMNQSIFHPISEDIPHKIGGITCWLVVYLPL